MKTRPALLVLLTLSSSWAHSGFNTVAWRDVVGPYTLTVLEDLHVSDGSQEASVVVQLSGGEEAAPAGTRLRLELSRQATAVYEGELSFIANGTQDGKTFYSSYVSTLPITEAGPYGLFLRVDGPLGGVSQSYQVKARRGGPTPLEYLPSVLILAVTVGGLALLFAPIKRKDTADETPPLRATEL